MKVTTLDEMNALFDDLRQNMDEREG
jgi:hypothetical protein